MRALFANRYALLDRLGQGGILAEVLMHLGEMTDEDHRARAYYEQALGYWRDLERPSFIVQCLLALGQRSVPKAALNYGREALAVAQASGDEGLVRQALRSLVDWYAAVGQAPLASLILSALLPVDGEVEPRLLEQARHWQPPPSLNEAAVLAQEAITT